MTTLVSSVSDPLGSNFVFSRETTVLANPAAVLLLLLAYLGAIAYLSEYRKDWAKYYDLRKELAIHNFAVAVGSAILFVAMGIEILRQMQETSFYDVWCDPDGHRTKGYLYGLYYINYLFKWWELADTFFLALRGKQLEFLHVYHHVFTILLVWSQLAAETCQQWVAIFINLGVHIVMYTYFGLCALGYKPWWKQAITTIQIVQFYLGCASGSLAFIMGLVADLTPFGVRKCHGSWPASIFGMFVLSSYLVLFNRLNTKLYGPASCVRKMK